MASDVAGRHGVRSGEVREAMPGDDGVGARRKLEVRRAGDCVPCRGQAEQLFGQLVLVGVSTGEQVEAHPDRPAADESELVSAAPEGESGVAIPKRLFG